MDSLRNISRTNEQQKQEPKLPGLQELVSRIAEFYDARDVNGIRGMYLEWGALNQRLNPKLGYSDAGQIAYSLFERLCVSADYFIMTGDVMPYHVLARTFGDEEWAVREFFRNAIRGQIVNAEDYGFSRN